MPVKESPDLGFSQSFRGSVEGLADALGGRIDGSGVEEETGAGQAVVPYGQGGLEVAGFDEGAAIEGGVDGAEAQNLCFSAAGGGTVYVCAALTQGRIAIIPQLASGWGAAEDDPGLAVHPVEG